MPKALIGFIELGTHEVDPPRRVCGDHGAYALGRQGRLVAHMLQGFSTALPDVVVEQGHTLCVVSGQGEVHQSTDAKAAGGHGVR